MLIILFSSKYVSCTKLAITNTLIHHLNQTEKNKGGLQ